MEGVPSEGVMKLPGLCLDATLDVPKMGSVLLTTTMPRRPAAVPAYLQAERTRITFLGQTVLNGRGKLGKTGRISNPVSPQDIPQPLPLESRLAYHMIRCVSSAQKHWEAGMDGLKLDAWGCRVRR